MGGARRTELVISPTGFRPSWSVGRRGGWRDGIVEECGGHTVRIRYLTQDATVVCWHHNDLSRQLRPGAPVRLHEEFHMLAIPRAWICVLVTDGLGRVPTPDNPELWNSEIVPGIVDLATGIGLPTDDPSGGRSALGPPGVGPSLKTTTEFEANALALAPRGSSTGCFGYRSERIGSWTPTPGASWLRTPSRASRERIAMPDIARDHIHADRLPRRVSTALGQRRPVRRDRRLRQPVLGPPRRCHRGPTDRRGITHTHAHAPLPPRNHRT